MKTFRTIALESETHGIISGRFEPVTKIHASIIERIGKENKKGTIFIVNGKTTSKDKIRNPFSVYDRIKMLEAIKPNNVDIKVISTGFFVDELNEMEDTNFIIYAGSDRVDRYRKYSSYMNEGKNLTSKEIKRVDDDISATKVREALINNDRETFKNMTDERIHEMFEELQLIIRR